MAQHGEKDLLFLLHMQLQFLAQFMKKFGQAMGAADLIEVHMLYPLSQTDQLRQLFAVALVIARENMVYQLASRRFKPVTAGGLFLLTAQQLQGDAQGVQALGLGCLAQNSGATTAKIQVVVMEYTRCTGYGAGQLAKGLVKQIFTHDSALVA